MSVVTHERLFPLRQAADPFSTNSSGLFYHVHKRLCNDCRDPSLQSCDYPGLVFSSWEEAHCFVSMFHRAKKPVLPNHPASPRIGSTTGFNRIDFCLLG